MFVQNSKNMNVLKFSNGFTLIEVLVSLAILSMIAISAVYIGFPEYDRYLMNSEREYLTDALIESRARTLVSGSEYFVNIWSNGYCIKDDSDLCVVPAHDLPVNFTISSFDLATSTKIVISTSGGISSEINLDQNGFIDGR